MLRQAGLLRAGLLCETGLLRAGLLCETGLLRAGLLCEAGLLRKGLLREAGLLREGLLRDLREALLLLPHSSDSYRVECDQQPVRLQAVLLQHLQLLRLAGPRGL